MVRKRRNEVKLAQKEAKEAVESWKVAFTEEVLAWNEGDTLFFAASEGDSVHVVLRRVAISCDAYVRSMVGKSPMVKARASRWKKLVAAAEKRRQQDPEVFETSGANAYLASLKPLLEQSSDTAHLVVWHNRSIELFNAITMPMTL